MAQQLFTVHTLSSSDPLQVQGIRWRTRRPNPWFMNCLNAWFMNLCVKGGSWIVHKNTNKELVSDVGNMQNYPPPQYIYICIAKLLTKTNLRLWKGMKDLRVIEEGSKLGSSQGLESRSGLVEIFPLATFKLLEPIALRLHDLPYHLWITRGV